MIPFTGIYTPQSHHQRSSRHTAKEDDGKRVMENSALPSTYNLNTRAASVTATSAVAADLDQREAQATDYLLWVDSPNSLPNYASIPRDPHRTPTNTKSTSTMRAAAPPPPPSSQTQGPRPRRGAAGMGPRRQRGSLSLQEFQKFAMDPTNPMLLVTGSAGANVMDRLEEWLVLEIHKDAKLPRQFLKLTVRGLYRYVLNAITDRSTTALQNAVKLIAIAKTMQAATSAFGSGTLASSSANIPATVPEEQGEEDAGITAMRTLEEDLESTPPANVDLLSAAGATALEPTGADAETEDAATTGTTSSGLPRISLASARRVMGSSASDKNPTTTNATTGAGGTAPAAAAPTVGGVTYRERLGGYLHPRDMRRLVTPFSTSNEPGLIVRRHVMLLNFDPVRAILLRDRMLVIVPTHIDQAVCDGMLDNLEQRVRSGACVPAMFGDTSENPIQSTTSPSTSERPATTGILNTLLQSTGFGGTTASTSSVSSETVPLVPETSSAAPGSNTSDDKEDNRTMECILDDEEFDEMKGLEWANLPFELQCADAVLHEVAAMLALDTYELQTASSKYIDRILRHHDFNDDPLTIIRTIKDAVQEMTTRTHGFIASMHRILDDDASMALMNLSRLVTHPDRFIQPVPQRVLDEESDEPELILEASLHIGTALLNYLARIQGQINTAKELVDQKQDAMRNRLLFADMMISVFSLVVALASMVGSFFGMNVPNGWEANTRVFPPIVYYTVFGCSLVCIFIMAILWFSGTIPHSVRALTKDVQLKTTSRHSTATMPATNPSTTASLR